MIIEPKVRGFICTTAHPLGCAAHVQEQIDYVQSREPLRHGPKHVLVIGASMGYGLASRIMTAFGGSAAATMGVFFEKPAEGKKTASAGWYNSAAFEQKAQAAGLYARSFNGDAFSDAMRDEVVQAIAKDWGRVDSVVYSLASPRRQHPKDGHISKSVLKPIGKECHEKSLDLAEDKLVNIDLPPATEDEIKQTTEVMGGEDWSFWIDALEKAHFIKEGFTTVAYSYIGPKVTYPIYREGTIGRAKEDLEEMGKILDRRLKPFKGRAFISVNKALVTQSSSAIPFIPLYYVLLSKVLKEKNLDEGCIEQMCRLFKTRLYNGGSPEFDTHGLIRMDDLEMRDEVQSIVEKNWRQITNENLRQLADLDGYHAEFLKLFGFGFKNVNYQADVDSQVSVPSLPVPHIAQ